MTHRNHSKFCIFVVILVSLHPGCASNFGISPTGTTTVAAPRPTGTILAQGTFTPSNGQSDITGSAFVFNNGSSYILRIEGLNITWEAGLVLRVIYTPSSSQATFNLLAPTGNQNYTLTGPSAASRFNIVYITSTLKSLDYASAILTYPRP